MLIYLDLCCLKRPFDDQSQARIRLESEAVLGLLAAESPEIGFVRSAALVLENAQNPVIRRAARVRQWLESAPIWTPDPAMAESRTRELMALGLRSFDALHVASAELAHVDALASCDDRCIAACRRAGAQITTRVVNVVELAREVLP